ncbi:protein kinase [Micromonospora sp. NPDC049679]|uniref:serine/threonine-protein kinase n=1 Tax=Micromonospora sp. NPDC049679 TaxID=3155920 RepID=UPI0033CAAF24
MSTAHPQLVADRYRLMQPLGQGGMGRVWKARDEVLHRDVAIKELVPPPGLTPEERQEMRERSLREARAIARLNHINVVRVFDVLRTEADPWIVMEYVASRSLQDVLASDGPVSSVRAAEIGLGVLGALRAAHRSGVMHRDVKPGNVLLGDDGRVVLTDFGLATVPGDPNVTRTGLVLGSPAYISPERARTGSAGPEADMWSLGATLYAAVEGHSPYARPSAIATLSALATEPPPPPKNAGQLKSVLNGLLRKDPVARMKADEAERLLLRASGKRPPRVRRSLLDGVRRPSPLGKPREPRNPVVPVQRPPADVSGIAPVSPPPIAAMVSPPPRLVPPSPPRPAPVEPPPPVTDPAAEEPSQQSEPAVADTAVDAAPVDPTTEPSSEAAPTIVAPVADPGPSDSAPADPALADPVTSDSAPVDAASAAGTATADAPTAEPASASAADDSTPAPTAAEPALASTMVEPAVPSTATDSPPKAVAVAAVPAGPAVVAAPGSALRDKRTLWIAAAVLALLVLAIVVIVASRGGDQGGQRGGGPGAAKPTPTAGASGGAPQSSGSPQGDGSGPAPSSVPPTQPSAQPTGAAPFVLPAGWEMYKDPTGFSVPIPKGWQVSTDEGGRVQFVDARGGRMLMIDQTDSPQPDPVADWKSKEEYRRSTESNYQRVGQIHAVDYGVKAADWEWLHTNGGTQMHVRNRGFIAAKDKAYALYWETPASTWEQSLADYDVIASGFQPVRGKAA